MTLTGIHVAASVSDAPSGTGIPVLGIDHVELYVGNSRQAAWAYERLGFRIEGYCGPETGHHDRVSWSVRQGDVRLLLTGGLSSGSPITEHVCRHGDSVRNIAFAVPDAADAFDRAVAAGAVAVEEPTRTTGPDGAVVRAAIAAYGPVVHSFVTRSGEIPTGMPDFRAVPDRPAAPAVGIRAVDHVVAAVPAGQGDDLVAFYRDVIGFEQLHYFDDSRIKTEYTALMNKVMADGSGRIKLPIVEPGRGTRRSQVQEFLDFHEGPGVQHIALLTDDIVGTVEALRRAGLGFLHTPDTYFDDVADRVEAVSAQVPALRRNGILADRDDEGHLLQIFARTLHDRPTLFLEIIERHGAIGLGEGNIRALYEALEREQDARGNL